MKKVLVVTAIRSDYYFSKSIFKAIDENPELELGLVVSGAHLSPLYNYTYQDIEKDGFKIIGKIDSLLSTSNLASRLKSVNIQLPILTHIIEEYKPDILLAIGDREEPIITALCGAYLHIPVVHYCAGDRSSGNVDATVRFAISDLSHILLTISEDAKQRLIQRGEEVHRVFNVGHSGLDRFLDFKVLDKNQMAKNIGINQKNLEKDYFVVVQHPISSQVKESAFQIEETLKAIVSFPEIKFFVGYPNTDAGSYEIIEMIKKYDKEYENIIAYSNLDDTTFVSLLKNAKGLIGNSSLGVFEAPFFNLPVINIGQRQRARYCSNNITFVDHDNNIIKTEIQKILSTSEFHFDNPFGDGTAGKKVADILSSLNIDEELLHKKFTY